VRDLTISALLERWNNWLRMKIKTWMGCEGDSAYLLGQITLLKAQLANHQLSIESLGQRTQGLEDAKQHDDRILGIVTDQALDDPELGAPSRFLVRDSRLTERDLQHLQDQIDELRNVAKPSLPVEVGDEPIMRGHVRFTQRKKQYEASHRAAQKTPATEQIERNAALIALGRAED
jgi:hypothetical protein